MWDLILNPFITALTFLYQLLGENIVLAIVVFTILIRLLTFPLTAQQLRSQKAMQALQPELKKLQEKHKNDREKLAQEQMALYREHGVSPLGGCLPLLIQFPIIIGLYQAITHALAATPLQLLDLSNRFLLPGLDQLIPLNNIWLGMDLTQVPQSNPPIALVLPVIVVITTWLQQKLMTPPAPVSDDGKPDQAQQMTQSMLTIMPLMFGFFALSFSVGLSIYFIVSNLVGIGQYALTGRANINNLLGKRPTTPAFSPNAPSETKSMQTKGSASKPSTGKSGGKNR